MRRTRGSMRQNRQGPGRRDDPSYCRARRFLLSYPAHMVTKPATGWGQVARNARLDRGLAGTRFRDSASKRCAAGVPRKGGVSWTVSGGTFSQLSIRRKAIRGDIAFHQFEQPFFCIHSAARVCIAAKRGDCGSIRDSVAQAVWTICWQAALCCQRVKQRIGFRKCTCQKGAAYGARRGKPVMGAVLETRLPLTHQTCRR